MPSRRGAVRPGRRPWPGAALAAAALLYGPGPGRAELPGGGPLPTTGLDTVRLGDLRGALESYLPNAPPRTVGRNWQVSASVGADLGLTDNAYRVNSPRRADVFALITPAVVVSGDTAHVQANAVYAPSISIYANNGNQTRVDQFGQAGALVTFVPDTLFLNLRGSVTESSATGGFGTNGFGNGGQQGFNRNNQVTSVALSASPYVQHRFGGWGTGVLAYSVAQTLQDSAFGNSGQVNGQVNGFGNQAFYGSTGNLTTQQERATFTTGENFGRVNDTVALSATQYDGVNSYRGAYRNEASNTTAYAVTRAVTALATIGYQDLRYGGTPGYRYSGPLWNVGGRYAPNPNLSLTLTYGERDGFSDFAADGYWSPSARTAIYVRYGTGLTSDAENLQSTLATTTVGPTGQLTDRTTGAPVSGTNGFFGTQNNLYELRRFSVTGLLSLDRDSFTASLSNEQRTSVSTTVSNAGQGVVPPGTSTNGTYGSVGWGHQLSDRLTSNVSVSYGVNDNGSALGLGSGSQTSFSGTAGLFYIISPTLTGSARYSHTTQSGSGLNGFNTINTFNNNGFRSGSYTENLLLVGLRKSF